MNNFKKSAAALLCSLVMLGGCVQSAPVQVSDTPEASITNVTESAETASPEAKTSASATETAASSATTTVTTTKAETTTASTAATTTNAETTTASTAATTTKAETTTASTAATTTKAETTTAAATTKAEATTTATSKSKGSVKAEWKLSSTWKDGDKFCGGYEIVITNDTKDNITGWKAECTVPKGFELTSKWNGIFNISGTKMTVSNESYNADIPSGGEVSFGFNYASPKEFDVPKLSINGKNTATASEEKEPDMTTEAISTAPPAPKDPDGKTPVAVHGQLSVKGTQIVDKNGNAYQLKGMSTHGITWFPDSVNENAFKTLRDDWKTNVVRMAMYTDEWNNNLCYINNQEQSRKLMEKGVDICIELGMYVIIDWHVLNPGDPSKYTDKAIEFFDYISDKYKDYPNIIYEICNEPNGNVSWDEVIKPYAEKVIPVIRKHDKDAIIIVGTPTWSQDIDKALANPLSYDNVMYALHFYAATHTDWLRDRLKSCIKGGLPVFVSEFGCCDASGNGNNDFGQARSWLSLLDENSISYCNWSLCNKAEAASALKPSTSYGGDWKESELSESGVWMRKWFRGEQ